MKWQVVARPQAEDDIIEAADWYDTQRAGLGDEFIEELIVVFDALEINPFLSCRKHPAKNIRWRYPKRFPYRVIYEVIEDKRLVIIAAVVHAVRHDRFGEDACEAPSAGRVDDVLMKGESTTRKRECLLPNICQSQYEPYDVLASTSV